MSGDVGADIAAVIESALRDRGWLDSGDAEDAARDIAPLFTERVRAAQAEAWDQGWLAGCDDCQYGDENAEPWTPNPYRPGPRP